MLMADIFDELDFDLLPNTRDKRFRIEDVYSEHLKSLEEEVPSSPITSDLYSDEANVLFIDAVPIEEGKDELSDSDKAARQSSVDATKDDSQSKNAYEPQQQPMEIGEEYATNSPSSSEHESPSKDFSEELRSAFKRKRSRTESSKDPDYEEIEVHSPTLPRRAPSSPNRKRSNSGSSSKGKSSSAQNKSHRGLPKEATNLLKGWLLEHVHKPYPTEEEKTWMISETALTMTQLNNFFTNARRRYLKKILSKTASHSMSD